MASLGDGAFKAFARGCASQGAATPCRDPRDAEGASLATCVCGTGPEKENAAAAKVASRLDEERERNPTKMKQLHDKLVQWLSRAGEGPSTNQPLRHFHIGVLLVHLNTVYDLVEGLPVAFVWKLRQKNKKSSRQPSLFSSPFGWPGTTPRKEEEPKEDENKDPSPQLVLTKVTVALSSDLVQLEMHHAHEVQMVPLTHVAEVWEGLDGTMGGLDEWCAVIELSDNQQYPLRFFERSQVKPFIAVVLALSHLMCETVNSGSARVNNSTGPPLPQASAGGAATSAVPAAGGANPQDGGLSSRGPTPRNPRGSPRGAQQASQLRSGADTGRSSSLGDLPAPSSSRAREEWV